MRRRRFDPEPPMREEPCVCGEPLRVPVEASERDIEREMHYHVRRGIHSMWSARRMLPVFDNPTDED